MVDTYVPMSVASTPRMFPVAWNETSTLGAPASYGRTRVPVILPDSSPSISPNIVSEPPTFLILGLTSCVIRFVSRDHLPRIRRTVSYPIRSSRQGTDSEG